MKKALILVGLALVLAIPAHSFGIGAAYNINVLDAATPGAALSFKLDGLPLIGVSGLFGTDLLIVGSTFDWWLYQQQLGGTMLGLYAGVGGYASIIMVGNNAWLDGGVRVPVGINIYPIPVLELFLEIAPAVGITLSDPVVFPEFGLQGAFGFRFWFN